MQTPERAPSLGHGSPPPSPRVFPSSTSPATQALGQRAPGGAGAGRVSGGAGPKGGVEQ